MQSLPYTASAASSARHVSLLAIEVASVDPYWPMTTDDLHPRVTFPSGLHLSRIRQKTNHETKAAYPCLYSIAAATYKRSTRIAYLLPFYLFAGLDVL